MIRVSLNGETLWFDDVQKMAYGTHLQYFYNVTLESCILYCNHRPPICKPGCVLQTQKTVKTQSFTWSSAKYWKIIRPQNRAWSDLLIYQILPRNLCITTDNLMVGRDLPPLVYSGKTLPMSRELRMVFLFYWHETSIASLPWQRISNYFRAKCTPKACQLYAGFFIQTQDGYWKYHSFEKVKCGDHRWCAVRRKNHINRKTREGRRKRHLEFIFMTISLEI